MPHHQSLCMVHRSLRTSISQQEIIFEPINTTPQGSYISIRIMEQLPLNPEVKHLPLPTRKYSHAIIDTILSKSKLPAYA